MSESPSFSSENPNLTPLKQEVSVGKEKRKESMKDIPETLRMAIDIAMQRILTKINSSEGLKTDAASYCREVKGVLIEMDAQLPKNHLLKGTTGIIIDNYLTPEEVGAEFIRTILAKGNELLKEKKKLEIGPKEFDSGMLFLRSSLGFAIDLAKTKPEKIPLFMKELERNEQIKTLLVKFPDLQEIFTKVLPELARHTDKGVFFRTFDSFIKNIRPDIIGMFSGHNQSEDIRVGIALKIANESARFTTSLLSEETVKTAINSISQLPSVQSNPLAKTLFSLVQREELSDEDRLKIAKKGNEGLLLITKTPRPTEKELEEYINSTIVLLSGFATKLPKELISEKISELFPKTKEKTKLLKVDNAKDFLTLLWDDKEFRNTIGENKMKILKGIELYLSGKLDNIKDFVSFILDEKLITNNIEYTKGHLVERLKSIININLSSFADAMRVKLAQDLKVKELPKIDNIIPKTGDVLGDKIAVNLSNDIISLFFSENRPKSITQEVLTAKTIDSIRKTISSIQKEALEIQDKNGKDIATVPKSTLLAILDSETFKNFLQTSFSSISEQSMKNGDFMKNILKIVDEIKKDPLGNKYTGGEKLQQSVLESFYTLPPAELAKTLHGNLEITGMGDNLKDKNGALVFDKEDIQTVIEVIRERIPKPIMEKVLANNKTMPIDIKKIIRDIFEDKELPKDTMKEIINLLSDRGIVSKMHNIAQKERGELSPEKMNEMIDMIFLVGESTDSETRTNLLSKLGIDANKSEAGLVFLKSLGKERAKDLAVKHIATIDALLSGKIQPLSEPQKLIPLLTDILYTFNSAEIEGISQKMKHLFPELENFLNLKIGGENIIAQIDKLKNVIPRESLQAFLEKNAHTLVKLSENRDKQTMITLGADLFLLIPREKLTTLFDANKLSETEKFAVENLPKVQDIIATLKTEHSERFNTAIKFSAQAMEGTITEDNSKMLAGEIYSLIGEFITKLGADWKLPEGEGEGSDMTKRLKNDFIKNNLSFIISQAFPFLFGRTKETIISLYFHDAGNKDNFVKMILPMIKNPIA